MMGEFKAVVVSISFFAAAIIVGSIASSTAYTLTKSTIVAGVVAQIVFIVFSIFIVVFLLHRSLCDYGFRWPTRYGLSSIPISIAVSLPLALIAEYLSEGYVSSIAKEDLLSMLILALFVAPLGEETIFRGLIESYLLEHTDMWIAIVVPAVLFSAMHVVPYFNSPPLTLFFILLSALILGLLAGYFRAKGESLFPAVTAHIVFNFTGIVIWKIL
ncbi:MAG: CPBP family intramembrane metalloprotease [Thermoprotei archaeon]|nr:MAG: CPBP family intramembrane metalloprotease [Thermoprotei archaeon]